MSDTLKKLQQSIESGKINQASPYPPNMKNQIGADELTKQALDEGIEPETIVNQAMIPAMDFVGQKFAEQKLFVPQMLMSAKSMSAGMEHIKPFFKSGAMKKKGTFLIGTVFGDLHDIGKNLVKMMIEGAGWEVIDLGVDVKTERFVETIEQNDIQAVGLSALLTTTMVNMKPIIEAIRQINPEIKILVGGAPVNEAFCQEIGADNYSPNPKAAVNYLNSVF